MLVKTFIIGLIVYPIFSINPIYAHSPQMTQEEIISQMSITELVTYYSKQYNVSGTQMLGTLRGESGLNPKAVGDGGCSHGVAQINLCAHKHITKEQAQDPRFAIEFMAKEFSKGNQRIWTVWRNLYK